MILFKKKYKAVFLIIPLILLYRYDLVFFAESTGKSVSEVFLMHLFGGSYHMEKMDLAVSVLGLVGIVFVTLLFADYIVRDLTENAEYIFCRYINRRGWYLKKLRDLFLYCNLGIFLCCSFYVINAVYESNKPITTRDIFLILCTYIMLLLFTYCSVLCINLLSLFSDTTIAFVVFYSILIISSMMTIFIQGLSNEKIIGVLHKVNPMSNIFVSWNFNNFHVLWGMGYYVILSLLVIFVLWKKVKYYEIGIGLKNRNIKRGKKNGKLCENM